MLSIAIKILKFINLCFFDKCEHREITVGTIIVLGIIQKKIERTNSKGRHMVAINPKREKIIKLSKEEQEAILMHCPSLDYSISSQIANSTDGFIYLPDYEAHRLWIALQNQISHMDSEEQAHKVLCRISNKLNPNPVIASLSEELSGRDFKNIEELQEEVTRINERYNNKPDPEMAGLSPNQVSKIINLSWDDDNFPIKYNKQLSIDDLQGSYFFHNSRTLLNVLMELEDKVTATAAGNLNRKVLELLFDKILLREADKPFVTKFDRSFSEDNVYTIHETKIICRMANIIRKTGKKFIVTEKYKKLLLDDKAGELYYLLFSTFFRRFNMAYRDGFGEFYPIQSTIPFSFYVLSKFADGFFKIKEMEEKIFLPAVRREIIEHGRKPWDITGLLHTRIIEPLLSFGLIEVERVSRLSVFNIDAVKKTELFDRFMRFSV